MVHRILGSTANWQYGANQFVKMLPDKVMVNCSERNMHKFTLDGIDVMGERLAEEVVEVINRRPRLRKMSFIAHSVGGLVARYAIGRLYRPPNGDLPRHLSNGAPADGEISLGTICGLEAINFITVATPHLGSRGNWQVPFLFGVNAIEKVAAYVIHWGSIPSLEDLGLHEIKCDRGMKFVGGESAALGRVYEYFWKKDEALFVGFGRKGHAVGDIFGFQGDGKSGETCLWLRWIMRGQSFRCCLR